MKILTDMYVATISTEVAKIKTDLTRTMVNNNIAIDHVIKSQNS